MVLEMNGHTNRIPQTGPPPDPVVVPTSFSINLSFMMSFHIVGRLSRLPSLLSEGFKVQMYIASFTGDFKPIVFHGQYFHILQQDGVVGAVRMHAF